MCLYMVWNLTFNNEILSPPSVISGIHNATEPKNVFVIFLDIQQQKCIQDILYYWKMKGSLALCLFNICVLIGSINAHAFIEEL